LTAGLVVVTGAARGIGRAAVEAFFARGARVVALDRSWDGAEAAAAAMDGTGLALVTTADITDPGSVAASRDAALARFGQVDVLINNAACRQRRSRRSGAASASRSRPISAPSTWPRS
jgi:1,1a-dihydroxy-1-hydro-9-fluorenone dehydrogenase